MSKKKIIILIISVLLLLAAFIYRMFFVNENSDEMMSFKMPVAIYHVKPANITEEINSFGTIAPINSAIITSEVASIVKEVKLAEGSKVKKGDILFILDDAMQVAEKNAAQSDLDLRQKDFARAKELLAKKVISQKQYDDAENNMKSSKSQYSLAVAKYDKTHIKAPFNGDVGISYVTNSQYVTIGDSLTSIQDIANIQVSFSLSEKYLSKISKNNEVILYSDIYKNQQFKGVVIAIDEYIDPKTRNFMVKAQFSNQDGLLKAGSYARLKVVLNHKNKILIPENALLKIEQGDFVYVMIEEKAKMIPVKIGMREDVNVEITEGIKENDAVITSGLIKLRDGADVMDVSQLPKQ
jgi:membrane fusion protein, multidrug efflux system